MCKSYVPHCIISGLPSVEALDVEQRMNILFKVDLGSGDYWETGSVIGLIHFTDFH